MINGTSDAGHPLDLSSAAQAVVQQKASAQELLAALVTSTVYCVRPDRPGVFVADTDDGQVVGVCTSLQELARFAGECDWFSTDGADLLSQLPAGVDIILDPAGPAPLRISPEALKAGVGLQLTRLSETGEA